MPISNIFRSPAAQPIEAPAQHDARLIQEQQEKFIQLIEQDNGSEIGDYLKNPSTQFELSSGPCTLQQLLEKCEPPLMHTAMEKGKLTALHALIYNMPTSALNLTDNNGRTLLMLASEHGLADEVKLLLATGAAVSVSDQYGNTSLMWAALKGFANIVAVLLGIEAADDIVDINRARSELVNARNHEGKNALMLACEAGHLDVVQAILAVSATQGLSLDLDVQDNGEKSTWRYILESNNREIAQAFVQARYTLGAADIDTMNELSTHPNLDTGTRRQLFTPYLRTGQVPDGISPAWTTFGAGTSAPVSSASSASATPSPLAPPPTSMSSAPIESASQAAPVQPRPAIKTEGQVGALLKRLGTEIEIDDSSIYMTPSSSVLRSSTFLGTAAPMIGENWGEDSPVEERQFYQYMALGEIIVNTLHDPEFMTGSVLTVPTASGERLTVKNSIEITRAIAWYCLALAAQRDQPQSEDDSRRLSSDTAPLYSIPDPKGNLFNYLETLEWTSGHNDVDSEKVEIYPIEHDGATETLVIGANSYFPGDDGHRMIYRRIAGEGRDGQLVFRFPVAEELAYLFENMDAKDQTISDVE